MLLLNMDVFVLTVSFVVMWHGSLWCYILHLLCIRIVVAFSQCASGDWLNCQQLWGFIHYALFGFALIRFLCLWVHQIYHMNSRILNCHLSNSSRTLGIRLLLNKVSVALRLGYGVLDLKSGRFGPEIGYFLVELVLGSLGMIEYCHGCVGSLWQIWMLLLGSLRSLILIVLLSNHVPLIYIR